MPILNVACSICTDTFNNADDIYSTSCGHIFHSVCMRDWQSRAPNCPQCRVYNPKTHKIYLSFDDSDGSRKEINDLKMTLQCTNVKIRELHDQLEEQCTTSEEIISELQEENLQCDESEGNFLSLQRQYTLTEDYNKELQESVQLLSYEIESKTKELQLKTMQVATLQSSLEAIESQACETILNEKIEMLEQKLKHFESELESKTKDLLLKTMQVATLQASLEALESQACETILNEKIKMLEQKLKHFESAFEKEITNSTQLSIDKMKLQSFIDRMKLNANNNDSDINENINSSITSQEEGKAINHPTVSNSNETNEQTLLPNISHSKENEPNLTVSQNIDIDSGNISSVVINGYPLNKMTNPLENIIIAIAAKMDLFICKEDLIKVNKIKNNQHRQRRKCGALFVQFRSLDLKIKFISNKNRLRNDSTTKYLTIKEYADDLTFSLLVYAKQNLLANGFQYIFCKNNQVIAKKHQRDPKGIRIFSTNQVDDLLKGNYTSSEEPTTM